MRRTEKILLMADRGGQDFASEALAGSEVKSWNGDPSRQTPRRADRHPHRAARGQWIGWRICRDGRGNTLFVTSVPCSNACRKVMRSLPWQPNSGQILAISCRRNRALLDQPVRYSGYDSLCDGKGEEERLLVDNLARDGIGCNRADIGDEAAIVVCRELKPSVSP